MLFRSGAAGTVLGTLLAFSIIPLGQHDWQLAAIFSANYIGGTMNYVSAAKAVGLQDSKLLNTGMAVDHLMMIIYFLILFSLPSMYRLRARFRERPIQHRLATEIIIKNESHTGDRFNLPWFTTTMALSLVICAVAFEIENRTDYQGSAILMITLISITLASVFRSTLQRLDGATETGTLFMYLFFATLGAHANISMAFKLGPMLFLFATIILIVHLLFILIIGKYTRLSLPEILIASNANMGGATTAVAMTAAKRWHALIVPAVLCGTLGYATGDYIAIGIGKLLH